nr:hypothetical protein TR92_01600 [Brucella anthropi]
MISSIHRNLVRKFQFMERPIILYVSNTPMPDLISPNEMILIIQALKLPYLKQTKIYSENIFPN